MPEDLRQIEWTEYGQTVTHPLALLLTFCMVVSFLAARRVHILIPMLIVAAFITSMQRVVLGSLDFTMLRLMMVAGIARAAIRNDAQLLEWSRMDSAFAVYVVVASLTYIMLWRNSSAIVNRLGFAFEAILAYGLIRVYVHSEVQVTTLIRGLAVVFAGIAVFMLIEQATRYNFFSVFGGVSPITRLRAGRLRAQGAFSHPIMAGTFGGTFAPLFWALASRRNGRDRRFAVLGSVGAVSIVWASSSSGPVISLLASLFAVSMWNYRQYTAILRRGFFLMLLVLHIVMDAPVWHLISRVDIVGGSTGWHRYALIDAAIRRFPEWAAFGVRTSGHWGWGLNDVTNHFILQAVNGGFLTLLAFIILVGAGFRSVRRAIAGDEGNEARQKMHWAWGSVLFSHCISFIGVSYFGQMNFFWYLTLGLIACLPSLSDKKPLRTPSRLAAAAPGASVSSGNRS